MQQSNTTESMNFLTPSQIQICKYAQIFMQANNQEVQKKLKQSNWRDIYTIIVNTQIDNNTRIVCCSVLKWLIYHKKFVDQPMQIFKSFANFYMQKLQDNNKLSKAQQILQVVLKTIPNAYLKQKQKQSLILQLMQLAKANPQKSNRILKLIQLIVNQCQAQTLNNQILVGQISLYLQQIVPNNQIESQQKLQIIKQSVKILQTLIDLINNDDQPNENIVSQYLSGSINSKQLLQKIISDGSNNIQIITNNKNVNQLKLLTLQLYSSIWMYYLDQFMFKLCLNSLLTHPISQQLIDQKSGILQKIISMLQRSINQQNYYEYLHKNLQQITFSLFTLLRQKQSLLAKINQDPQQYVDILTDLCMQQHRDMLQTKVCSLISCLCLYIDGYMSFIGSLCVMIFKKFNNTINDIVQSKQYMETINKLWQCNDQQKISICVLIMCAISDQLQKRTDLFKPLQNQLIRSNQLFNINICKLPIYLICRFMFLYSFLAYPKCLDIFLAYKNIHPIYQYQLQSCYNILNKYYSKYPQYKIYIQQLSNKILIANKLTPLLEKAITNGEFNNLLQFQLLQKLVLWLQQGINKCDIILCNKYSNLLAILIDKFIVDNYQECQEIVFKYLQPLMKQIVSSQKGKDSQQFLLQVLVAYIKRFPSLANIKSQNKLKYLFSIGYQIVQRNFGNLNSCLNLFFYLTKYINQQLINSLIQIYINCLCNKQQQQYRQQDHWQCYYGLQCCMLRLVQIKGSLPNINIYIKQILTKIQNYKNKQLIIKSYMFLYSLILVNPYSIQNYQQYIINKPLPTQIPPYQNKPYCLYLLNLVTFLQMSQDYAYSVLIFLLHLIQKQKQISTLIKQYQDNLYNNIQQHNQVAINAFGITRELIHPLLMKGIDIYQEFRKCWAKYPHREYIINNLDQSNKKYLNLLCTQTTVNHKVRKIYKIKVSQNQIESQGNKQSIME